MKKSIFLAKASLLTATLFIFSNAVFAQCIMVKAYNQLAYYNTSPSATFTWSGGISNGYCNGYGTIQWYNKDGQPEGKYVGNVKRGKNDGYGISYFANGYKGYDGYWVNDMKNGYGTSYYSDGSVMYKGYFSNDKFKNEDALDIAAKSIAEMIVEKIFEGGTTIRYSLVKASFSQSNSLEELRVRITFNGNIVTSNYYEGTVVIKDTAPFIDFVNYNDMFGGYITGHLIGEVGKILYEQSN